MQFTVHLPTYLSFASIIFISCFYVAMIKQWPKGFNWVTVHHQKKLSCRSMGAGTEVVTMEWVLSGLFSMLAHLAVVYKTICPEMHVPSSLSPPTPNINKMLLQECLLASLRIFFQLNLLPRWIYLVKLTETNQCTVPDLEEKQIIFISDNPEKFISLCTVTSPANKKNNSIQIRI